MKNDGPHTKSLIHELDSAYHGWCSCNNGVFDNAGTACTLFITPFLTSRNDRIVFYIRPFEDGTYELNDDGEAMTDLGRNLGGLLKKRRSISNHLESVYCTRINNRNELCMFCRHGQLSKSINIFITASLYIRSVQNTTIPSVQALKT